MSPEALDYLTRALDYIERNSVMRGRANFAALRSDALTRAEAAAHPTETRLAIRSVLVGLGDRHSALLDAEVARRDREGLAVSPGCKVSRTDGTVFWVFPDTPAAHAGLQVGDAVETINGTPLARLAPEEWRRAKEEPVQLTVRRGRDLFTVDLNPAQFQTDLLPEGQRLRHDVGYLHIPWFNGPGNDERGRAFAGAAQEAIRAIDREPVRGWVLDLRRNTGGNMWPMVAGVGPLLGEGAWDIFASPELRTRAGYRDGQAFIEWTRAGAPRLVQSSVAAPYRLKRPEPPVAVLTAPVTASSGEFVALCFRGLPRSRSFGEPTVGVPTANSEFVLPDGAILLLTTARGVDRAGKTYDAPLQPDEYVKSDWSVFGTDRDPLIQASIEWIEETC